ncbi:helix-turn-helix transcriptional regulator [Bacillus sp. FSL K6-3431]|uniref:helix-turn-helix transcriptional regulator n=1 Tax=Bacillus sp. FSL K6-3431 TaxID=2921500 RepID=UPI0030F69605
MKRTALSNARKQKGYSQTAFAEKLDISTEHVRSMEYGRANPSTSLMFKICSELDSTPDILFKDLMK